MDEDHRPGIDEVDYYSLLFIALLSLMNLLTFYI